ncbi:hypothetical protein XENOCAPTIV_021810 [Xenoophorus captivus]|uniref:Uncharacterized protein n=1 Tax=Xenoophorus captivus TaxID=1517983 RepID=A0ABV0S2R9_9TELE
MARGPELYCILSIFHYDFKQVIVIEQTPAKRTTRDSFVSHCKLNQTTKRAFSQSSYQAVWDSQCMSTLSNNTNHSLESNSFTREKQQFFLLLLEMCTIAL